MFRLPIDSFIPIDGMKKTGILPVTYEMETEPLLKREIMLQSDRTIRTEEYVVLRYRAAGLRRLPVLREGFLYGVSADGETPLVFLNDMFLDGREHLAIAPCTPAVYDGMHLRFGTRAPFLSFTLTECYTCRASELPPRFRETPVTGAGYVCVDLASFVNGTFGEGVGEIDGGIGFPTGEIGLSYLPFRFADGVVRPSAPPAANEDVIRNFTAVTKRRYCRPESRESRFEIPLRTTARELYFVLAADGNTHERCGFCAADPTVVGCAQGEVMMPLCVNDIERFAVILRYEDGTEDECFPENVETHRHEITGEVSVLGVRASGAPLAAVAFENRMLDTDLSLCALTLNEHAPLRLAEPFATRKKHASRRFDLPPAARVEGDELILTSGAMRLVLDTKEGLFVREAENAFAPFFRLSGALLRVRTEKGIRERFERLSLSPEAVTYRMDDVRITVTFQTDVRDGIRTAVRLENDGEARSFGLIYPALNDVCYRTPEETWYFLPKYQNTESNGSCYVYEESAPSFPMQFLDLFSPEAGAGLALLTRERDLKVRKYALSKHAGRTDAFLEYPAMYLNIPRNGTFFGSETRLFCHEGDWHAAYADYKAWLCTWYEPYRCQDKTWYRRKFWLAAEITDFVERDDVYRLPVWYDEKEKKYRFREIFAEMKEIYGETPDILHLWGWAWDAREGHQLWGNFGESDYEKLGGLENFRRALHETERETGAEISLYLHPTLLSECYPAAREYPPSLRVCAPTATPSACTAIPTVCVTQTRRGAPTRSRFTRASIAKRVCVCFTWMSSASGSATAVSPPITAMRCPPISLKPTARSSPPSKTKCPMTWCFTASITPWTSTLAILIATSVTTSSTASTRCWNRASTCQTVTTVSVVSLPTFTASRSRRSCNLCCRWRCVTSRGNR